MSVYYTNESAQYCINLNFVTDCWYMDCSDAIINGERKLLHNEIGCSFVVDGEDVIRVLSGWHIGTEDFEWDEEGYDWVLEKYHPGITKQLLQMIKEES